MVLTALAAVGLFGSATSCRPQAAAGDTLPLRILYVGHPGSAREADFLAFLKQHFRQVETANLRGFRGQEARDADVVLLDYDGNGFKAPRPKLPDSYARPTVTIGVAGGLWASRRGLKTGYM